MKRTLLSLAAVATLAGTTHAAPLDIKSVPADTKWVVHLDVDALAKSETWKRVQPRLLERQRYTRGKAEIERLLALQLPQDLHDVTLFGPSVGEKEAVILIRSNAKPERVKTLLSLNETYALQNVAGRELHGWEDNGKQIYAVIGGANLMILGQSVERVTAAADVIDGKSAAIESKVIKPAPSDGLLIYVAGDQLAALARQGMARSPLVGKMQSAVLTARESADGLEFAGDVVAQTDAVAANLVKAIEGFKSLLAFAEDPDAGLANQAMGNLKASQNGTAVNIDCTVAFETLQALLERADRR